MKEFENLREIWISKGPQAGSWASYQRVMDEIRTTRAKYLITQVILGITVFVLVWFYIYISGFTEIGVSLSIGAMIFAILTRGITEWMSAHTLKKMDGGKSANDFAMDIKNFYNRRKWIHYLMTPLCLALYVGGFLFLLPYFERSLSPWFYNYIVISSVILLIVGIIFFAHDARSEQMRLKELLEFIDDKI